MSQNELVHLLGLEVPIDAIRRSDGSILIITNYDEEQYRRGYLCDPRNA